MLIAILGAMQQNVTDGLDRMGALANLTAAGVLLPIKVCSEG